MSKPLYFLEWAGPLPPPPESSLESFLEGATLVAAHTKDDMIGRNIIKIADGQEDHPFYLFAVRNLCSRLSTTYTEYGRKVLEL